MPTKDKAEDVGTAEPQVDPMALLDEAVDLLRFVMEVYRNRDKTLTSAEQDRMDALFAAHAKLKA